MSVCQSGEVEEDSGTEEVTPSAVRELYKQKPASKVVRVLTVLAYLLSVSLAAILLSVYYVCVWKSPELPPVNETEATASRLSALRGHVADYALAHSQNDTGGGGGDSGVNALVSPGPVSTTESPRITSTAIDSTTDLLPSTPSPPDNSSYSSDDFEGTTTSIT